MDLFEKYQDIKIEKELRIKIRNKKNEILSIRFPNGGFLTEEHEQALKEACLSFGIIILG